MPGTKWGQRWGDPWGRSEVRITALKIEVVDPAAGILRLSWASALHALGVWYKVFRDGKQIAVTRELSWLDCPPAGEVHVYEVIDVGPLNGDPGYDIEWAATAVAGNKALISWDQVAGAATYAIFWDAGTGTVSYTTPLVVRQDNGLAAQSWLTGELAAGTYKFVVRSRDAAGNESDNTTAQTVVLAPLPRSVRALAVAYSDPTRQYTNPAPPPATLPGTGKVTLTWKDPPGLGANDRIQIYQTALALPDGEWDADLGTWPDADYTTPIATILPGTETWESAVLDPLQAYTFAARVYSDAGAAEEQNTDIIARLELAADGADTTARPARVAGLAAQPLAGGAIRLTGLIPAACCQMPADGGSPVTGARVLYSDNLEELMAGESETATPTLEACADGWRFSWDSPMLVDGTTYYFMVRAGNGAAESDFAPWAPVSDEDIVEAVADATGLSAPAGQAAAAARG